MAEAEFVLLGFVDKNDEVKPENESRALWKENLVGGKPYFPPSVKQEDLKHVLSSEKIICSGCQNHVAFITQISCPVDEKLIERSLYVFACVTKDCSVKKWHIVRVMARLEEETAATTYPEDQIGIFRQFYLTVEEEEVIDNEVKAYDMKALKDVMQAASKEEVYEKFLIPGTDQVADKFFNTLSKFPRQIIRYCWMGTPLLNQDTKLDDVPNCDECGARRTYEMQIMPAMISVLRPLNAATEIQPELDYGTVLCFTCINNCHVKTASVERVIVLNDPDSSLLNDFRNGDLKKEQSMEMEGESQEKMSACKKGKKRRKH